MATKAAARKSKKKSDVNKSEEIRNYLAKHRKATPIQVKEALAEQGIDVTPALVSQVKSKLRKKRPRRTQPANQAKASPVVRMDDLLAAKSFIEKVGSLDKAQSAIGILARLRS